MTAAAPTARRVPAPRNNSEVAHHWAHRARPSGASGNVSHDDPVLYSYAAPIAVLVPLPRGGGDLAVFTGQKYSVTTSAHASYARSAARHLKGFTMPEGLGLGDAAWHRRNPPVQLRRAIRKAILDFAAWLLDEHRRMAERGEFKSKVQRAKSWDRYCVAVAKANHFSSLCGLPKVKPAESDGLTEDDLRAYRRARAEREAAAEEQQRRIAEDARKSAEERISLWLEGSPDVPTHLVRNTEFDHLRVMPNNPEAAETNRGALVPVEHIRRAAPLILRAVARGEAWEPNGKAIHLGPYAVSRIDADGTVVVGCHRFARAEIERFAASLGLA